MGEKKTVVAKGPSTFRFRLSSRLLAVMGGGVQQRWKKFFPCWEPTFAAEKFLQNFATCKISNY